MHPPRIDDQRGDEQYRPEARDEARVEREEPCHVSPRSVARLSDVRNMLR